MTAPTREQYADADRLLRDVMLNSRGQAFLEAAGLLLWIEATKPAPLPDFIIKFRPLRRRDRLAEFFSTPLARLIFGCITFAAVIAGAALAAKGLGW